LRSHLSARTAVIELANGTYALGGTQLSISHDVTIQAAPGATVVLDGGYGPSCSSTSCSSRVLFIGATGATVTLIGLDITGGYSSDGGAGVAIAGGDVTFNLCSIYGNTAYDYVSSCISNHFPNAPRWDHAYTDTRRVVLARSIGDMEVASGSQAQA